MGRISSDKEKMIEMYVSAHDRSRLEIGQESRFTVDGLLQTEFGSVEGVIDSISADATLSDNGAFFKVTVRFTDTELTGKHGEAVTIKNGMTVRTWTVYEKSTYMDYFLEHLGFR